MEKVIDPRRALRVIWDTLEELASSYTEVKKYIFKKWLPLKLYYTNIRIITHGYLILRFRMILGEVVDSFGLFRISLKTTNISNKAQVTELPVRIFK